MHVIPVTSIGTAFDQTYYPESIQLTLSNDEGFRMKVSARNHSDEVKPVGVDSNDGDSASQDRSHARRWHLQRKLPHNGNQGRSSYLMSYKEKGHPRGWPKSLNSLVGGTRIELVTPAV